MRAGLAALILASAAPVAAEIPFLTLPLDCTLGQTCFIEDYLDTDAGADARDYTCGYRSRDGHRGTDFALLDWDAMERGTAVLAAAPGVVEATRDGMEDVVFTPETAAAIEGRECGNAVRIRHENGLQTLYCHMKRGSIAVRSGDSVAAGDVLGMVGLSGLTNYPHVHLSVLKDGADIDPFSPGGETDCTAPDTAQLWLDPIAYEPTGYFTAGFADGVPAFEDVISGLARREVLAPTDPMVLYVRLHNAQPGDVLRFRATGPGAVVFDETTPLDDPQLDQMQAFGRRAPAGGWAPGSYEGYSTLMRGQTVIGVRHATVVVR